MKAWEFLTGPEVWTQGTAARNAAGEVTDIEAGDACRWCLVGFLSRAYGSLTPAWNKAVTAIRTRGLDSPADWNDAPGRTWQEVRDLLKELDL